ncbi:MAG: hypothetical protein COA58_00905 [Bacteroidetes bacterium]|nr:MAG: hypothetical protein COA58_00905 [Bacteroidota bacterium]
MKRVILMRHAKSSWTDPSQTDHQRVLNNRGKRDTPIVAAKILAHGILPELIYVSDAQRTQETWELLSKQLPKIQTIFSTSLYLASSDSLIETIKQTDNLIDTVMLIAHNPGITEAFYSLGGVNIDNVPTCGVGCLTFHTDKFENITDCKKELEYFYYPKML